MICFSLRVVGDVTKGFRNWSHLECQRMRRCGNRKDILSRRVSMNTGRKTRGHADFRKGPRSTVMCSPKFEAGTREIRLWRPGRAMQGDHVYLEPNHVLSLQECLSS